MSLGTGTVCRTGRHGIIYQHGEYQSVGNDVRDALELIEREIAGAMETLIRLERAKAILKGNRRPVEPPGYGPQPELPDGWKLYRGVE